MARRRRAPAEAVAGERGVAVAGDVTGSLIVTGDDVAVTLQVGPEHGALLEQLSLRRQPAIRKRLPPPPPRRSSDHVDRDAETGAVLATVREQAVNVHGEDGIGKTWVLRDVAARAGPDFAKDGVAFLPAHGRARDDLLQDLFEALYDSTPPTRPSSAQVLRAVGRRKPLVLFDSLGLEPADTQTLVSSLPTCAIAASSRERLLWEGRPLMLGGLPLNDALAVLAQELGRPVEQRELRAAERLWQAVGGNPLRLRQAAAVARERGVALDDVAPADDAQAVDPAREAVGLLDDDDRLVLAALTALGGADVGTEPLAQLAGRPALAKGLERLGRLELAETHDGRARAAATAVVAGLAVDAAGRVVDSVLAWLRSGPPLSELARELPALVAAVGLARRFGRLDDVLELALAADDALALGGRWDEWQHVLEAALEAARGLGDRMHEARALHQLGTRAAALGDRDAAAATLGHALELRRELGDHAGARATEHNLAVALARPSPLVRFRNRRLYTTPLPLVLAAIVVVLLLLGGTVAALALGGDGETETAALTIRFVGNGEGSVRIDPSGLTCDGTCMQDLDAGTPTQLRPSAAGGSRFAGWDGCPEVSGAVCELTPSGEVELAVRFALRSEETNLLRVSTENGRVATADLSIDCPSLCEHPFPADETVTLTATADPGFALDRWEGCDAASADTCEVALDADRDVTAVFAAVPGSTLAVTVDPAGGGTVAGASLSCTSSCSASFPPGTTVTLTASQAEGFAFDRWEGCDSEPGGDCVVGLATSRDVTAFFRAEPQDETLTVAVASADSAEDKVGGRVASRDGRIACPSTCDATYPSGTAVKLDATPNSVAVLDGWDGCTTESGTTCDVTVDASRSVTATFRYPRLELEATGGTLTYGPDRRVCPDDCSAGFAKGSRVTIDAAPDDPQEFTFVEWGGACAGVDRNTTSCTVTVDGDTAVSAVITTAP